jgi:hypothetical protein
MAAAAAVRVGVWGATFTAVASLLLRRWRKFRARKKFDGLDGEVQHCQQRASLAVNPNAASSTTRWKFPQSSGLSVLCRSGILQC